MTLADTLAHDLLGIGAVTLRPDAPFTWASGRLAPVYTDNRLTLSHPEIRGRIADGFAEVVRDRFPRADAVSATATAGIAPGALLADRLGLPFSYVRSKPKGHGRENRVEGAVAQGQRVVIVEDLVSTGGSVLSAAEALRERGAVVVAALAVFTYGFPDADQAFEAADLPLVTLTDFAALARAAHADLGQGAAQALDDWRRDPAGWSRQRGGEG